MYKKTLVLCILSLLLVSSVSAMSINYYFNPECGHCQNIAPFMEDISNNHKNINWNFLDTSKGSYEIDGTPTLKIKTNDNREIKLVGSYEIPKYLECEFNEQSNLNCQTYSYLNCTTSSFFIR